MIGLRAFGEAVARGRDEGETHIQALAASYERILRRAGEQAASRLVAKATLTASDWQPPPEGILYTGVTLPAALVAEQKAALGTILRAAFARSGILYDPASAPVRALLAQTQTWTGSLVDETVIPQLQRLVADAFGDGLSVKDAAALIRATFSEFATWQSEMLARSTLNMLGNGGAQYAVEQYNARAQKAGQRTFRAKRWLTAHDAKVRATHRAAEGQTVPVNQPFTVGGSQLMFPGDPAGALAEVLNCRCTVIYAESGAAVASAAYTPRMKHRLRAVAAAVMEAPTAIRWRGVLTLEGIGTGDGRWFAPGCWSWREPPLTLSAQTVTDEGHDGAAVAGRIDRIWKEPRPELGEDVVAVMGEGVFDDGDYGQEIARMVDDETLRGNSVDYSVEDMAFRDPASGDLIAPDEMTPELWDRYFAGDLQVAALKATIAMSTICPFPAFEDAALSVVASAQGPRRLVVRHGISFRESLTASAAGLAPLKPPASWFNRREPDRLTPLTVTDKGQVYGHIAPWNACHTGKRGECFQPPASPSGYAYFNLGEIECADGSLIPCGQITMGTDHAAISDNWRQAKAHYEDTGIAVADVRASDGLHGIWVCGAVRPHVSAEQVRELRGAKPSGDWRQITMGGPLEMIGALEVNIPGYPVPRPQLQLVASAAFPAGEVVALTAGGLLDDAGLDVSLRVLKARAEGMDGLLALAQS